MSDPADVIIGQAGEDVGRSGPAANLTPFVVGDGRAVEAAKRSAEVRRAKRDQGRREASAIAAHLATLRETHERHDLGPTAAAAAVDLIGRITSGEVPVRNGGEAAELLRALVDVARLEAGEPTSASVVAHLGADAAARVVALREEARATLRSSTVQAAAALPAGAAPSVVSTAGDDQDGGVVPA